MKKFNKKTLTVISLTLFSLNCSMAQGSSAWKKNENQTKEDCVNCYADIDSDKKATELLKQKAVVDKKEQVYRYDDTLTPSKTYHKNGYKYQVSASDTYTKSSQGNTLNQGTLYSDERYKEAESKRDSSHKIAIQVGAFRRYAGAKIYAKKYAILSSKYNVEIQTGVKDQRPIYRVRIEGFSSRSKAKEFKRKYGLTGAFLVMR